MEKIIRISEYGYYEYWKKLLNKDTLNKYKNRLVLFYDNWNDFRFETTFWLIYFNKDLESKELGIVKICNFELEITDNDIKKRKIIEFLKRDGLLEKDLGGKNSGNKLKEEYYSIVGEKVVDNLVELMGMEEAIGILKTIRDFTTLTNENVLNLNIKDKQWYKDSFIRNEEDKKIVDFTQLKAKFNIEESSHKILLELEKFSNNIIGKNADLFYEWLEKYKEYFTVYRAKSIVNFIKKNERSDDVESSLLYFKEKFSTYAEFVKEIDIILSKNPEFYNCINEIKNILKVNELKDISIGHYTSLNTLPILINKKEPGRLRLTNASQMNDPREGKVLLEYVLEERDTDESWKKSSMYISSATTEVDSLPMWEQYASKAEGVMLVYHEDFLEELISNKCDYIDMYRVAYIDIEKDEIYVDGEKNNTLKNNLKKLKRIATNDENINKAMLDNINYLFKKKEYLYEKEYRIIVNSENENAPKVETKIEYFPYVYMYIPIKLDYSRVILGPKSMDIDYIAPYIKECDEKIEIDNSKISYR